MSKVTSGFVGGVAALALFASAAIAEDGHDYSEYGFEPELGPSDSTCEDAGISEYFCAWATDGGDVVLPERYNDAVLYSTNCKQYGDEEAACAAFSFQLLGGAPVDPTAE